ncbi:MAG: sigma-54 dependent transcriptional regulator [bacterium]
MNNTAKILVIEDDPDGLRSVEDAIRDAGYQVISATTGRGGCDAFLRDVPDVVLSDLFLPDIDGLAVLENCKRNKSDIPVLIMTAYGSVDTAVRALKQGAYDYLVKPLDLDDLQSKVARALEASRLRVQVTQLRHEVHGRYSAKTMVAGAPVMQELLRQIAAVAGTHATVLVMGESGTGKELVARALHADGKRADGPFVAVNCGAFAETLLESELFGHEKGAFTGAVSRHEGAFERASGGTLFLDEIGIAPKSVQARLLRVLEEREVLRVGGREPFKVDVRVVAASNRDLNELVEAGEFRHDLLYRLQVVTLRLPALRERREDIPAMADRFVVQACAEHGRHIEVVSPEGYAKLVAYPWPGNVRELKNVMESAVILATGPIIQPDDLKLGRSDPGPSVRQSLVFPEGMTLADLEKEALMQALRRHEGNRQLTADELGISARTIQRKIREYNLPL